MELDQGERRMKVLALDFGSARTGVAVSDPTGTVARPLDVVEKVLSRPGLSRLVSLIKSEHPDRIVVGMPLTLRGERGEQARATDDFVALLAAEVDVPIETYDERFTTGLAQQTPSKAPEDARAAAHLLSSYLEWSSAARA
jgi:putative Holliday junction resolvase